MVTILFDGISYGMLLFVLAAGLCVTLGLMNFVNLSHGAFAMIGGYLTIVLLKTWHVSFYECLPIAFVACGALGGLLEVSLFRRLYDRDPLDQVLFTIAVIFMSIAVVDYFMGANQQTIDLPASLQGRWTALGGSIAVYRVFLIAVCGGVTLALQWILSHTRVGNQLRAAVDDGRAARGLGVNVTRIFAGTFIVGCGLAGLGGALATGVISFDPTFPLKYMIYFLVVISVGGATTISGPFMAAILLGVADVAGEYFAPAFGGFIIYTVMVVSLIVRPQGLFARTSGR